MPRVRIVWSPEAKADLQSVRRYIARDAPRAATALKNRILASVQRLKDFPELGALAPEFDDGITREIQVGVYRILYRFSRSTVRILAVHHGARLLGEDDLPPE